jgi:alkylation response protein AidB-like acyl-CoA dehydrogenase
MGITELNLTLTEEQKALCTGARRFFREVWRPASIALDQLADPAEVIAPDSVFWETGRKTFELGYHKMGLPEAIGGLGLDPLSMALLTEEMGYASPGLAASWMVCGTPFIYAMMSEDPQVRELALTFCADTRAEMTGCWAITEPEHGSDWLLLEGGHYSDPKVVPQVRAVLDGDHYLINGQKAAWVSNGTISRYAALFLNLDPAKGMAGGGVAVVPLDLPGVSRGKPLAKIGQRDLNQGEIYFDKVRLPKSYMVAKDPEIYQALITSQLATANAWMGSCFTGLAHAAYDEALSYARQRLQGGRPIIEHQNIKLKLFDMFAGVEAARALSRQVMVYNFQQIAEAKPPALEYSVASKVFCTETAFRVASQAIQIFGGNGLSREYAVEKLFRDARASMIQDGINETLAIGAASRL